MHAVGVFDAARASDHAKISAADFDAGDINDTGIWMRVSRCEFIRRQNRDDFGDTGNRIKRFGLQFLFVTDDADDRAKRTATEMMLQTEIFYTL